MDRYDEVTIGHDKMMSKKVDGDYVLFYDLVDEVNRIILDYSIDGELQEELLSLIEE